MSALSTDIDSLLEDLNRLLQDQKTADVVFLIGPEQTKYYAHKIFLWSRCRFFQKYDHQFWQSRSTQGPLIFKYPQYESQHFIEILSFIYTGRLQLNESSVFALLVMSRDLGMENLTKLCETHVLGSLTETNACQYLSETLELNRNNPEIWNDRLVRACTQYIENHAEGCAKSEGWLELNKQAVVQLISSDSFALEEEDVWRTVLSWARFNAGVPMDKHPRHWTSQEKSLVSKALVGVLDKVKFMLIDSRVFAEEVEPTGLVPMEVSLEKYRTAAVAESEHSDYTPRVALKLFQNSVILDRDNTQYQRLLSQWYGDVKQSWTCIYRASRDGSTAEDFHRCCDGSAPTFVVIQSPTGNVCGGFSDVPWTSSTPLRGRFIPSRKTFLFTLINKQGVTPTKFDVTRSKYATLHHPDFGPIFGAGADLSIASNCVEGMECYSNLGHSYEDPNASCTILMGEYDFNVADYEVFTLSSIHEQ